MTNPTRHYLLAVADFYAPDTRTTRKLIEIIGEGDDPKVGIAQSTDRSQLQLRHKDGRIIIIDLVPILVQAEQLFAPAPPATDIADALTEFERAARAHALIGMQPAEERGLIEDELAEARAQLWEQIRIIKSQRDQMAELLDQGGKVMHDLTDNIIVMAEEALSHLDPADPGVAAARTRLAELRAMAPDKAN